MQLRYNYRLYPTAGQRQMLARTFGCCRVVYNDFLAAKQAAFERGEKATYGDLNRILLKEAKRTPERSWLAEVPNVALAQSVRDAQSAYSNFFKSLAGQRKGARMGAPRFKSRRDHRQSARFTRNGFRILDNGKLRLSKIGDLKVAWSRNLPDTPSSATIVKDAAERYFVSFVVEVGDETLPEVTPTVGIDMGLSAFAVLSDGTVVESPRFMRRAERKLRKAQQALSRKQRGSRNRDKARLRVAKAHAKVADQRNDFTHKLSSQIARENQAVAVEDLCVKGLARTRLSKSVHDAGWGMFLARLESKCARYGREFVKVDRFFPSSQLCSTCGASGGKKPLHVRQWRCGCCGAIHDRDLNAAKNIQAEGLSDWLNARGGDVRPAAPGGWRTPTKQEPTEGAQAPVGIPRL